MNQDGMDTTIGSESQPDKMDMTQQDLNHLLMLLLKKLTLLIHNLTISLKDSQVIDSRLNGPVFLESQKEENSLSKLDQMMDQDFGLTMLWLLIIGVSMELGLEKDQLNYRKDIMKLRFICLKTEEVLLPTPTGTMRNPLTSHQFTFSIQVSLIELKFNQTQFI